MHTCAEVAEEAVFASVETKAIRLANVKVRGTGNATTHFCSSVSCVRLYSGGFTYCSQPHPRRCKVGSLEMQLCHLVRSKLSPRLNQEEKAGEPALET